MKHNGSNLSGKYKGVRYRYFEGDPASPPGVPGRGPGWYARIKGQYVKDDEQRPTEPPVNMPALETFGV
jgi:hypothetical protein